MSSSPRKVAANRANACKSTGPRTVAGKARARLNATTHGIFCSAACVGYEDRRAFRALRVSFIEALRPQDVVELSLVDRVVLQTWRLQRSQVAEHTVLSRKIDRHRKQAATKIEDGWVGPYNQQDVREIGALVDETLHGSVGAAALAADFLACKGKVASVIDRMSTYERRLETSLHRAMTELRLLRKDRGVEPGADLPASPFLYLPDLAPATDDVHFVDDDPDADERETIDLAVEVTHAVGEMTDAAAVTAGETPDPTARKVAEVDAMLRCTETLVVDEDEGSGDNTDDPGDEGDDDDDGDDDDVTDHAPACAAAATPPRKNEPTAPPQPSAAATDARNVRSAPAGSEPRDAGIRPTAGAAPPVTVGVDRGA